MAATPTYLIWPYEVNDYKPIVKPPKMYNNGGVGCIFSKNGGHIYEKKLIKKDGLTEVVYQCQCGKKSA
jgi:hypothetical protein